MARGKKKTGKEKAKRMSSAEKRRMVAFLKKEGYNLISMQTPAKELRSTYKKAVEGQKTRRINKQKVEADIIEANKVKKKLLKRNAKGVMLKPIDWRSIPEEEIAAMKIRDDKRIIVIKNGAKWEYDL